jgi:hypothetical protein
MSDLKIKVEGGELTLPQAVELARLIRELDHSHWHFNECGCCVSLHGRDCAYVIGPDGGATFFAERGCGCEL